MRLEWRLGLRLDRMFRDLFVSSAVPESSSIRVRVH